MIDTYFSANISSRRLLLTVFYLSTVHSIQTADMDTRSSFSQHQPDEELVHRIAFGVKSNLPLSSLSFQNYTDYFKCIAAKGEDYGPCKQFKKAYNSLCPSTCLNLSSWLFSFLFFLFRRMGTFPMFCVYSAHQNLDFQIWWATREWCFPCFTGALILQIQRIRVVSLIISIMGTTSSHRRLKTFYLDRTYNGSFWGTAIFYSSQSAGHWTSAEPFAFSGRIWHHLAHSMRNPTSLW